MKTYIHVNQHKIKSNRKNGENEPVITVKQGRKNTYCSEVKILGPSWACSISRMWLSPVRISNRDKIKNNYIKSKGFKLLIVWHSDYIGSEKKIIEKCLKRIMKCM